MVSSSMIVSVLLLSSMWALGMSSIFLTLSTSTALVKDAYGTELSSLPLGITLFISSFASLKLLPYWEQTRGTKAMYIICALCGILGGICMIIAASLVHDKQKTEAMWFIIIGSLWLGVPGSATTKIRFTVLKITSDEFRATGLTIVVFGGLLSALLGPELSKYTRDALNEEHMGTYMLLTGAHILFLFAAYNVVYTPAALVATSAAVNEEKIQDDEELELDAVVTSTAEVTGINIHHDDVSIDNKKKKVYTAAPSGETDTKDDDDDDKKANEFHFIKMIQANPRVGLSIHYQVMSYACMAALMTGTPVAMGQVGYSFNVISTAVTLHIVGMFLPSLFTGKVIQQLGPTIVTALGFLIMLASALFFLVSKDVWVFYVGVTGVGVGWNWSFVASTAKLGKIMPPSAFKAKAYIDCLLFMSVGIIVGSAGVFIINAGWSAYAITYAIVICTAVVPSLAETVM